MKCHACYWCFFIRFGDISDILYVHYCALIPFCDMIACCHLLIRYAYFLTLTIIHICFGFQYVIISVFIDSLIDCHVGFILLVETRL